ncbi:cation-translocating P-type ATPase [Corallococcus exiguus]|uniref:cation-translocating P-type ATPase n=1 Tax=Corallococcus exiguus TaxID=83462 RepID=UPI001A8C494D|nr:cation-translocating P-type ATPase [Corallococcus exiguus]MBN8471487.1 cation-translocating P-type ATPase [Corallococcus exiguus]
MMVFLMDGQCATARVVRHSTAARRLRLEVPDLQWNAARCRRMERTFATWPGVVDVSAEPRTGRLLVRYAPQAPLLAQLRQEPDAPAAPGPTPRKARPTQSARRGQQEPWHAMSVDAVLARLDGTAQGLASEEAARRLKRFGPNVMQEEAPRSRLATLGSQLATVPTLRLLGSAGASALAGDGLEASAILTVVGLNAGIGYRIERRNQELLASWQKLEAGVAQVLRGGVLLTVPAAELVPGDVVLLRAGDVLPADMRVLEAHRLCADEAPLTRNEMRLEVLDLGDGPLELSSLRPRPQAVLEDPPTLALALGLLNSDVDIHHRGKTLEVSGSSTEKALVAAAHAAGLDGAALRRAFPRRHLLERSEAIHYVLSVHHAPGDGTVAFIKGAPEQVLDICDRGLKGPLDARERQRLARRNDALAADGLRVLALAWRRLDGDEDPAPTEGYTFIGFVGLRDPLREGAAESVRQARGAGIRTVALTGDQPRTAEAVARQVGLEGDTLTPHELAELLELSGEALSDGLARTAVLARVTPEDKRKLVKALRAQGAIVAMAGDGINDAPALRAADVGVAVGVRSSDMARAVADVVMASEDLRSIMSAVGEGRIVQDHLRRALRFLFATNLSEMTLVLGANLLGLREPLSPLQLLWINLLTDTLPGIALALEPGDPAILDRPPAPPGMPLLTRRAVRRVARDGALMAGFGALGMAMGGPPLAFGMLTAVQLGYSAVCRAPREPRRHVPADGEWRMYAFVGGATALHTAALTLPPLRRVLRLPAPTPLTFGGLAAGLILPALVGATPVWGAQVVRRARRMTDTPSSLETPA